MSTNEKQMEKPAPWQLWKQEEEKGGTIEATAARYIEQMKSHGYRINRKGQGEISENEACELYTDARLTAHETVNVGDNFYNFIDHQKGTVAHGVICSRSRGSGKMCSFCNRRQSEYLCDFETGEPCKKCKGTGRALESTSLRGTIVVEGKCSGDDGCEGTGRATCSKRLCRGCRAKSGKLDVCPEHRTAAGVASVPLRRAVEKLRGLHVVTSSPALTKAPKREECRWVNEAQIDGTCLHKGCVFVVRRRARCLYFPRRRRAMCAPCGAKYLQVTR